MTWVKIVDVVPGAPGAVEISMNSDAWVALVLGGCTLATLIITHWRERNPGPSTASRLTTPETDVAALKKWKQS